MSVDAKYLRKIHCFEDLSDQQIQSVAELAEAECFYPGHTLFEENAPGEYLFLLVEGEVEVLYDMDEGKLKQDGKKVDNMGSGDIIGCAALIPPYTYTSTMRSLTRVDVLAINARALREQMRQDCPLGFSIQQQIIKLLAGRIVLLRLKQK